MTIFIDNAPLYWAAGLNVIPLREAQKGCFLPSWQRYAKESVTEDEKRFWLEAYPKNNIGLPAGPASGVVFVDIDAIDAGDVALIESCLPKSPWRRVGKKGCVYAYRYNGVRSFKIKNAAGKMLVEFISVGGQAVMPPSIHPETKQAYTSNTNLWEVVDQLPSIDTDIENILRTKFKAAGIKLSISGRADFKTKISAGNRDNTMTKYAGTLAVSVRLGSCTLVEAMNFLEDWMDNMAEEVVGDPIDLNKGKHQIAKFLLADVERKNCVLPRGWDEHLSDEDRKNLGLDSLGEDAVAMPLQQIKELFFDEMSKAEENGDRELQMPIIVDKTLKRIARAGLNDFEESMIVEIVASNCGKGVKKSAIERGLRSHKKVGVEGINHTEIAKAVIADHHDVEMRFDKGILWEWAGSHWRQKNEEELKKHILEEYGHLPTSRKYNDIPQIIKAIKALTTQKIQPVPVKGINFANGWLTPELELREHDKDFGATYELPYAFNPELHDKCPRFLQYLEQAWDNDQSKIEALQQAIAVTLFGEAPRYQKCFLLYGSGSTGKSVLLDIISALVPDCARSALSPTQFSDKFKMAELAGKVLNVAGEVPENKVIQSDLFKKIIGGEAMMVERKNQDPFELKTTCAHWFAANNLPHSKDISNGFVRRWLIFGFQNEVPKERQNPHLAEEIICDEREAIAAWALPAMTEVERNQHLPVPPDCAALVHEMSYAINPIRSWFDDCVEPARDNDGLHEQIMYSDYQKWAMVKGHKRADMAEFKRTMRELAAKRLLRLESNPSNGEHTYFGVKIRIKKDKAA